MHCTEFLEYGKTSVPSLTNGETFRLFFQCRCRWNPLTQSDDFQVEKLRDNSDADATSSIVEKVTLIYPHDDDDDEDEDENPKNNNNNNNIDGYRDDRMSNANSRKYNTKESNPTDL